MIAFEPAKKKKVSSGKFCFIFHLFLQMYNVNALLIYVSFAFTFVLDVPMLNPGTVRNIVWKATNYVENCLEF